MARRFSWLVITVALLVGAAPLRASSLSPVAGIANGIELCEQVIARLTREPWRFGRSGTSLGVACDTGRELPATVAELGNRARIGTTRTQRAVHAEDRRIVGSDRLDISTVQAAGNCSHLCVDACTAPEIEELFGDGGGILARKRRYAGPERLDCRPPGAAMTTGATLLRDELTAFRPSAGASSDRGDAEDSC